MGSLMRRKKRRLIAEHFARIPAARKMQMVTEMNEVTRKLREGMKIRCKRIR